MRHNPGPVSRRERDGWLGTQPAQSARMARPRARAAVLAAAATALLRVATGCGTSNNLFGSQDAGEEGAATVDAADAGGKAASVVACARAQDCRVLSQTSSSVYCCTDGVCALDTPDICSDANVQLIQASNYDQSCKTDNDCVWVLQGNACHPLDCGDPGAINMVSSARYQADIAKTRAASCSVPQGDCPQFVTCCQNGSCQLGAQCSSGLAADAAADTGADACAPSGCATACPAGTHDVSSVVNGCTVWQCCVSDDAGADAATDAATDACAPSGGCTADCVAGRHNVTVMVDGCLVTECCVPDEGGTD